MMKHPAALLLVSLMAVFAPIEGMLATVAVLLFSDLVLGLMAARKRKEPITSSGLKRTVSKLLTYEVALMLAFLAEHYLTAALPFCKIIGGMISMTEMLSILENLNEISDNAVLRGVVAKIQTTTNEKNEDKK